MANNKITATVEVSEKGLVEVEQKGKKVNKQLTDIEKNAKAANKALARTNSPSLGKGMGSYSDEDYRVSRAAAGTGAAGRDFAKQAQGLGGLVHVYATFAANIFAVTAAFSALDKAYSVQRLEQAADIMSGKVGFSIKNLSKDLVSATGHAISFQEAMQFSAMGTAAGLTGKQITNLTIIAKGAANALGRDMGDAVRRIVQGTAKQEQEILDELGIFVRAKTAYAEYAKSLGMGVDELSASQRVQAYANAVENAGKKWEAFAKIDDPFSMFVAKGKEAVTSILNVVNAITVPILSLLANSKGMIEGLILIITASLLSRALPGMREGLTKFFTVDANVVKREADRAKTELLASNQNKLDALTSQEDIYSKSYVAKHDSLTESIERDEISLKQKTAQHNALLQSYDKEIEKKKLIIDLSKIDNSIASTKGLSTSQFKSRLTSPILPAVDLTNTESVTKAMQSVVNQQIRRGKESTQQVALEQAIKDKLIDQKSTIDNIILSENVRKGIAESIDRKNKLTSNSLDKGIERELKHAEKIQNITNKIKDINTNISNTTKSRDELTNTAYAKRLAYENQLNDLVAERVGLEESRLRHLNSQNAATAAQKIAQSDILKGISLDLGDAGGIRGMLNVVKTIPGEFSKYMGLAVGPMAKLGSGLTLLGFTGSLALRGLFAAAMPIMMLFSAWEMILKPLLYFFGVFSDRQDKIAEASLRVKEAGDSAAQSLAKVNEEIAKGLDASELAKAYGIKATAINALKESLAQVEAEMRAKVKEEDTKKSKSFTQRFQESTGIGPGQYSSQITAISAFQAEYKGDNVAEIEALNKSKTRLMNLETQLDLKYLGKIEFERKYSDELKITQEAMQALGLETQKYIKQLEDVAAPGATAIKAAETLNKHYKERLSEKLGFQSTEGQNIHLEKGRESEAFSKITKGSVSQIAAMKEIDKNSRELFLNLIDGEGKATLVAKQYYDLVTGNKPKEAESLLDYYIKLREKELKITDKADQAASGLFAQEQQLRSLQIEAQKAKQKGIEQEISIKEKLTGFKDRELLAQSIETEYNINNLEFLKNIAEINQKELVSKKAGEPLAKKIAEESRSNAVTLLLYTQNITEEKAKQLVIDSKILEYNNTIGALIKQNLERTANINKIADLNGLLSEADKTSIESKNRIFSIEQQLTAEFKKQKTFTDAQNAGEELQISGIKTLGMQHEIINIENETAAQLAKVARTQELSEASKLIEYYKLQTSEVMDKANREFDGVEAVAIAKKLAMAQEKKTAAEINDIYHSNMTMQEKSIALETLKIQKIKESEDRFNQSITTRQKSFSITMFSDNMQLMYDMAMQESTRFEKTLKPVVVSIFDGIYAGMDSAIDQLTTKFMEGQKFVWSDIRDTFKNVFAENLKNAASEQLKSATRTTLTGAIGALGSATGSTFNINPKQTLEDKLLEKINLQIQNQEIEFSERKTHYSSLIDIQKVSLEHLKALDEYFNGPQLPKTVEESTGIAGMVNNFTEPGNAFYTPLTSGADTEAATKAQDSMFIKFIQGTGDAFKFLSDKTKGLFSKEGALSAGLDTLKGWLEELFKPKGATAASGATLSGFLGTLVAGWSGTKPKSEGTSGLPGGVTGNSVDNRYASSSLGHTYTSANGNIMSEYGPLKLNKYASGGIATSPQISIFGEGSTNEAYVPLPDGRSIPVTMKTPEVTGGNTFNVSVTVNATTGETKTQTSGGNKIDALAEFGNLISQKVREELINQSRPNGLLSR